MSQPRKIVFYLDPGLRESAAQGAHNFLGKIADLGRAAGMEIAFRDESEAALSDPAREYAVVHMIAPPHENAVTVRRAYFYPFWSIERTEKRWEFDVARAGFDPAAVPAKEAAGFARRWRQKWFGDWTVGERGHVYIALQGRLLEQRSFQSCTPLAMVEAVLEHDHTRAVVAGLHPKEHYDPGELAALEDLATRNPRLTVRMGGMEDLLPGCDYVVTQNSSVGFAGYALRRPLVLFGRIDFHHIALKAYEIGAETPFAPRDHRPDFDAYLWWFP
ncbi:MAG: hypothetical protein R3D85_04915 [Paracoccaceae bacterium]